MPGTPGGPGPQIPGQATGTREQQIQAYASQIDSAYPPGTNSQGQMIDLGQLYVRYMNAHPHSNPFLIYEETMAQLYAVAHLGASLGGVIGQMAKDSGLLIGDYVRGVGKGAEQVTQAVDSPLSGLAAIGDFFSRLTNPHTWLRVAEVVIGVAALAIGLNALLHNPAGKVAKAVPKVVPV